MSSRLGELFRRLDIFGVKVGVNYKGDDVYRTKLGAFLTMAGYVITLVYVSQLFAAFRDGSKQSDSTRNLLSDQESNEAITFEDGSLSFSLLTLPVIPESVGKFRMT